MKGLYVVLLSVAIVLAGLFNGGMYQTVPAQGNDVDKGVYVVNRFTGQTRWFLNGVYWSTYQGSR